MCGLVGSFGRNSSYADLRSLIYKMLRVLTHRGPDNEGVWIGADCRLALGHRRLSVLDLSPSGHQPMVSAGGRYVLAFNGEIYNHITFRDELTESDSSLVWRGSSDTETLLAAFERWGVEDTLNRCIGMFAFALWDIESQVLTLARDRLGEKPLYYGWSGDEEKSTFVFGSELKAIHAYPGFNSPVSIAALSQYLRFSYVPAPYSIYEGVFKLEPGCMLTIRGTPPKVAPSEPITVGQKHGTLQMYRWWSLQDAVDGAQAKQCGSESAAIVELESSLSKAVESQSLADVPLGAFLSGGVDSSTVVALVQSQSSQRVKTFTIGFDDVCFDESPHARAIADHLGTDHHEMRVGSNMAQDVIPSLPWMYDEPFADSSQIPTYLVCKAARLHVTVALSGDGGDELFGGYNRYSWGSRIWGKFSWMPLPVRQLMAKAICAVPVKQWDYVSSAARITRFGDRVHKLGSRLGSVQDMDGLYWSLASEWDPAVVVKGVGQVNPSPWEIHSALPAGLNPVERMMFRDAVTFLPDDILCKVDRAAMACSLETRAPFLDHRVVELAWRLPLNMKIRGNTGKWALRQVLYKYVPKELIERPKAGFAIPIGEWLRGPLRDWAEGLLGETRLRQEGYFHPEPIRKAWAEHLTGGRDHAPKIWTILMFQAWRDAQASR
jgi:asparagine synthase (glutamine-hydrolysing)